MKLEFAPDYPILREESIGRYRVQAYEYPYPELNGGQRPYCYRVLVEEWEGAWRKVPCFTRSEERRFPKRAACLGTRLVAELNAARKATL